MANSKILAMAKEVKETTDTKKAAELVQRGWVIVHSAFQGDDIMWVLIRV